MASHGTNRHRNLDEIGFRLRNLWLDLAGAFYGGVLCGRAMICGFGAEDQAAIVQGLHADAARRAGFVPIAQRIGTTPAKDASPHLFHQALLDEQPGRANPPAFARTLRRTCWVSRRHLCPRRVPVRVPRNPQFWGERGWTWPDRRE